MKKFVIFALMLMLSVGTAFAITDVQTTNDLSGTAVVMPTTFTMNSKTVSAPAANATIGQPADDSVDADALADGDLGDVTVSSGSITLDDDVVAADELADGDLGDVSVSSGSVTLDAGVVDAAALATVVVANAANQACDTTCGIAGAIVGFDAGTSAFVTTANGIADSCMCDGATS
jgi:hypothetical protein